MSIRFQIRDALSAPEFERRGGKWKPDIHMIVPTPDEVHSRFVQGLLDKYSGHIEAYFIAPVFDGQTYSVELQFRDHDVADSCRNEYRRGFGKGGAVPKAKKATSRRATKRLYKNRMYRLPDGELFWYYAMWDRHGNLIGKVHNELDEYLHNRVIHRSVLEAAELVPKGEEPWLF